MKNVLTLALIFALAVGCVPTDPTTNQADSEKIVVATSFYPMTHFTEQVGGDHVKVRQIASQGTDPHSYEPTPNQMKQIFESDLLIYNGAGQDPYADRIHDELTSNGIRVLIATELVERMSYEREEHVHEDEEHQDEPEDEPHTKEEDRDDHEHGEWDPHVWLDPIRAIELVQAIATELSEIEPSLAAEFQTGADAYVSELRSLDADMQAGLSNCALDAIIVSHDAYRYLANRYGFYTFEIAGLSPSIEPSPARLAELTKIAQDESIAHVFFETQVSPALSETLAREINADTLVLHSIEALTNEERAAGKTYIDLQRMNLEHLRTALKCT